MPPDQESNESVNCWWDIWFSCFFQIRLGALLPSPYPPFKTTQTQLQPHLIHQQCLLFGSFWDTEVHPPVQLHGEVPHESVPETCSNMSAHQAAVVFCRSSDAHTMDGCIVTTFIRYLVPIYAHLPGKKDTWTNCMYSCLMCWCIMWKWDEPLDRQDAFSPERGATRSTETPPKTSKDYLVILCNVVRSFICSVSAEVRNAWCLTRTCTYKQLFLPGWHMVVTNWKNKTSTSRFDQELPICAPCTPVLCGTGAKDYFMHGSPFLSAKDQLIDWCISTS